MLLESATIASGYLWKIYSSHFWGRIGFSKISKFRGL
ncbi:hypothetical protein T10_8887 [Trichinella papuae]|uniref:Uncharacterized protein n=1 Tax=Trichinella papuae TaxID=268474 RepID=A0A0V1M063_9BILA|nr:hypothetical protein T10_8887 [Trichinella papuae]